MTKILNIIDKFEENHSSKILYITKYGSKLYGTDNENSDTDYKGIFVPSKKDVLLKRDIEHYNYNSNSSNTKNSKEDVDLQLYSIYKWFALLKKGETSALDLLFSLFREDTQVYSDSEFVQMMKTNYRRFYNRNLHSFVGYCVGQSKIYNIKGTRYQELHKFVEYFSEFARDSRDDKLELYYKNIEDIFNENKYKYIGFVTASVSKGNDAYREGVYVEVLGKKFFSTVTVGYFLDKISDMEEQFGNRSRASAKGIDYKALSHAVRVIDEVEELIDTNFITFPLKNAEFVKSIKDGREELDTVMRYIDIKLDSVEKKLKESDLADKSDEEFMDSLILELLDLKFKVSKE